jgi:hypothetical protein
MVMDILKFFLLFVLVLFAFSCGMNQLLWYYADLEKKTCYSPPAKWAHQAPVGGTQAIPSGNSSSAAASVPFYHQMSHSGVGVGGVGSTIDTDACIVWRRFAKYVRGHNSLSI